MRAKGWLCTFFSIFCNAEANAKGSLLKCAPVSSAKYSLDLVIANWMIIAMIGAIIANNNNSMIFPLPLFSLSRFMPPKIAAQRAIIAIYEIIPAMVAATVEIRMSLFLICPISCASTPRNSFSSNICIIPVVTATAACWGDLPVAKALLCGVSMKYTLGIGNCALAVISLMIEYSLAYFFLSASFALYIHKTILSDHQ